MRAFCPRIGREDFWDNQQQLKIAQLFDTHILSFRPFITNCWVSASPHVFHRSCRNSNLHLYSGLYIDDDLLDDLGGRVQTGGSLSEALVQIPTGLRDHGDSLDQSLVNPHLVCVPSLASLTTWCLARRDLERLGRKSDGALDAQILGLGSLNELLADLLQALHFAASQGDLNDLR